jgi:ribokinase
MFGGRAVAGLVEHGINVDHVKQDKCASGVALIFVAKDGENSIGVGGGANAKLSPADVEEARRAFADADVVMLQLETPLETVCAAAELAHASGAIVILNPAPAQPLPDSLLSKVSILTPNESEAELLTGIEMTDETSCSRAADFLMRKGVGTVIITLGARGAFVATNSANETVPGFEATPLDTTAAGDTFNGALAVGLAEGMPLLDAVQFANAAGAIAVTRMGAQPSAPSRDEIETLANPQAPITDGDGAVKRMHGVQPHFRPRHPAGASPAR